MSDASNQSNGASAHDALVLITQLCAEYVNALSDRPATQMCVKVQMQHALRVIESALPIHVPEATRDGGTDGQQV